MKRRIIIEIMDSERGGYTVYEGTRNSGLLAFDEMLGQIIGLTLGHRTYPMLTVNEWKINQRRSVVHRMKWEET